jgi:hypothetical protein
MKTLKTFVVAVVILSSFPVLAQQANANVQQGASATAAGSQVNQSAGANAQASRHGAQANGSGAASGTSSLNGAGAANGALSGSAAGAAEMRPVQGELVGKLDSKSARVGDRVVVKTTEKARTADGVTIPKGSRLVGHVTEVQAHGKGSEQSRMGIEFDRAELRGGQSMAIHSVIESVSPAGNAMAAADAGGDDMFGPGPAAGGGMAMGGGARGGLVGGGGGLVGGAGAALGQTTHAAGAVAGNAGAGLGSTANGALSATGATAMSAGNGTLRGAAAGTGSLAAHATGIPGVMLGGDASGSASGMLSASKKNVHLDGGTQMVLGVSSTVDR